MSQTMEIRLDGEARVDALYNGFEIRTDQSEKSGGGASAPEPFDLFLASLGTCAGIYVARFCQQRKIPIEGVRLVQSWSRDEKRRIEEIRIDIEVPEAFPEKYHAALVRAADQCSVKRLIASPPRMTTSIRVAP